MAIRTGEESSMFHEMVTREDQYVLGQQRINAMHNSLAPVTAGVTAGQAVNVGRGQWTPEEDQVLRDIMERPSKRAWSDIARELPGRIGKQCREIWMNHLDPEIKKTAWTEDEELMLVECQKQLGNQWAEMAKHIPGRSENNTKNRWNSAKRSLDAKRKFKKMARPSILEDYIRGQVKEKGTSAVATDPVHAAWAPGVQTTKEVSMPSPGSNSAISSQVQVSHAENYAPDLSIGSHPPEAMYSFAYPQENGYEPYLLVLAPGHPCAQEHQGEFAGAYYNQLQFHQHPFLVQQAFSNFRAAEDPNQALAGLYYHGAGPSNFDNRSGSGGTTGFAEMVTNQLATPGSANEGPALNG